MALVQAHTDAPSHQIGALQMPVNGVGIGIDLLDGSLVHQVIDGLLDLVILELSGIQFDGMNAQTDLFQLHVSPSCSAGSWCSDGRCWASSHPVQPAPAA